MTDRKCGYEAGAFRCGMLADHQPASVHGNWMDDTEWEYYQRTGRHVPPQWKRPDQISTRGGSDG